MSKMTGVLEDKLTSTKIMEHEITLLQNTGTVHVKPYWINFAQ